MVDDTPSTPPATDETPSSRNSSRSGFHSFSRSDGAMLGPSLRILCLHDGHSNAGELSDQLEVLGERLYEKHMIDLVYVNAPLLVKGSISETSYDLSPLNSNPQRIWWDEEATNGTPKYVGLDASLLLLRQIWNSMPFWGVIAVGKGAAAAAFLPLLPVSSPPQFMIFIRGETILEETELLVEDALSSTCLHMIEASPPKESSERLWRQFGGRVVVMGLAEQLSNKAMNLMGKFIVEQKKSLRTTNSDVGNILVLQNQLFLAEQEVANVVAQRIALDPPKALMAVISPQNVGGWKGSKRRAPTDEGGGAPCPSDFLLRREKRAADPTGHARHHPDHKACSVNDTEDSLG